MTPNEYLEQLQHAIKALETIKLWVAGDWVMAQALQNLYERRTAIMAQMGKRSRMGEE